MSSGYPRLLPYCFAASRRETMAVALEALLIPTDVRDHSGRICGSPKLGTACEPFASYQ